MRRFRRPFRRFRRRSSAETYTWVSCLDCKNVYGDFPCLSPFIDAIPLMSMVTPRSPGDVTQVSNPSDRAVVVKGIKFEAIHYSDPTEWISTGGCDPDPGTLAFFLKIWEAIVLLPTAQGNPVSPAYLPTLTSQGNQGGDLADRLLWKRISILPMWGLNAGAGFQLTSTERDTNAGPIVVKSRVRVDDRHALFYVRNYEHNLFGLGNGSDPNNCSAALPSNPCTIPVHTNYWFKVFYGTRK